VTPGETFYEVWWRDGTSIGAGLQREKCDDYSAAFLEYESHRRNSWHTAYALVRIEVIEGMEKQDED
jgi:hypothetical protein